MDSGRPNMSHEWPRLVSAEVKEEYMTLQGIQTYCSQLTSQNQKTVKSHLSLTLMRVKLVAFLFDLPRQTDILTIGNYSGRNIPLKTDTVLTEIFTS